MLARWTWIGRAFLRFDSLFQDVVYLVVVVCMEHESGWLLVERLNLSVPLHADSGAGRLIPYFGCVVP